MKIVLVYNSNSEIERNIMATLENKLGNLIISKHDVQDVKSVLPVRATPAFVILRDDLEGEELLDGDIELKIEGEVAKIMQEEELKIHNKEITRLDYVINTEKQKSEDVMLSDLLERGVI
jgi:hypothetical protein